MIALIQNGNINSRCITKQSDKIVIKSKNQYERFIDKIRIIEVFRTSLATSHTISAYVPFQSHSWTSIRAKGSPMKSYDAFIGSFIAIRKGHQISIPGLCSQRIFFPKEDANYWSEDTLKSKIKELTESPSIYINVFGNNTLEDRIENGIYGRCKILTVELSTEPYSEENQDTFESVVYHWELNLHSFSPSIMQHSPILHSMLMRLCIEYSFRGHDVYFNQPVYTETGERGSENSYSEKLVPFKLNKSAWFRVIRYPYNPDPVHQKPYVPVLDDFAKIKAANFVVADEILSDYAIKNTHTDMSQFDGVTKVTGKLPTAYLDIEASIDLGSQLVNEILPKKVITISTEASHLSVVKHNGPEKYDNNISR